jgi:plastocyanin
MSQRSNLALAGVVVMLGAALACGGQQPASSSATATAGGSAAPGAHAASGTRKVDPSSVGSVSGKVVFEGPRPASATFRMNADPVCLREHQGEVSDDTCVIAADGGLQNVFVYVKDGLSEYGFDAPSAPVTLDQKGCRYSPHVFGVQVGQPVDIVNSDATLHNVHAVAKLNQEFNTGQPIKGMKTRRTFTVREVMVPFKCDVHGWMTAFAGVLEHPFFAVTGADGSFELKGLPPGTYTIEAWHEKLGVQTTQLTLGPQEAKQVSISFKKT